VARKALVVGVSRNIGSAVFEELLRRGYELTGYSRSVKPEELGFGGVNWFMGDRDDRESFKKQLGAGRYDIVVDLAAFKLEDVEFAYEVFRNCGHYLVVSTAGVYGIVPPSLQPIREDIPLNPVSDYGKRKLAIERFCMAMYMQNGWPVTIVRPNHTYGRLRNLFRHVGTDNYWLDRIMKGKPVVVGNGQIYRSFTHVGDTARMIAGILEHPMNTVGQVYNTTNPHADTWETWHKAVMRALGRETELIELTCDFLRSYDIPGYYAFSTSWRYNSICSTDKLKRDVPEFTQQISLEEGLKKQVEYIIERGLIKNCEEAPWEDIAVADYRKACLKD
jgi:nucleoside-diphosphate-sugar epimerase